ncbi:lysophospholipid acyltransferase [Dinochytrium kinnereticum]|nr:lysophospholipid acyltransferase [Dinochytrium kinnereticum]
METLYGLQFISLFYAQILYPSNSDVSAPLMLMVIKLSTYAWAVYDGTLPEEQLSQGQKSRAVKSPPSLLEFLGYSLFFGGFLVGPAVEFSDYRRFTRGEAPFDKAPSSGIPSMKTLFLGILCFGLHMSFVDSWSHRFAASEAFLERPFLNRLLYLQVAGLIMRCKYYGAWKVSEGVCILAGIGYKGRDPNNPNVHEFNRCENVNILVLETSQSPRGFIGHWNMLTNQWLRNCVYNRLVHIGKQKPAVASLITWGASALWHGFYPCYYLTFLSGAILTATGITLRRNLRPLVTGRSSLRHIKPAYDVLGWMLTQLAMNYICAPFPLYKLELGLRVWASVYYIVHIGMLVFLVGLGVKACGIRGLVRAIGKRVGADYERSSSAAVGGANGVGIGKKGSAPSLKSAAAATSLSKAALKRID